MFEKCPGQDKRNLKADTVKCPKCGYKVEIFSDEIRLKCPKCSHMVFCKQKPSCVNWCKSSRECTGFKEA
jgi:DNA-directed RNA polymerase subunit RPC12/RpoP